MKTVLIIANLFHASPRIPGLVKYLNNFEWKSIILTTPLGEDPEKDFGPSLDIKKYAEIVEVENPKPITYSKGLYFLLREFQAYPDSEKHWIPYAYENACEIIENNKIDVILSSSSPVSTHIIANLLKEKYNIPWVADLRDLWSQNHNYNYSCIRKSMDRNLELNTLKPANALITVTPDLKNDLSRLHNDKKCYCVTNGFDPDRLKQEVTLSDKFTITYTGNIYKKQDPEPFLKAVNELCFSGMVGDDLNVRFYGPYNKRLAKLINEYGLNDIVKQYGIIGREEVFKRQAESHLLLLFGWNNIKGNGVYPLKVFEYLSARRPILLFGGSSEDAISKVLKLTNTGFTGNISNKIKYHGSFDKIKQYSHYETSKKYSEIFNEVLNGS